MALHAVEDEGPTSLRAPSFASCAPACLQAGVATQRMMLTDNDAARDELHNTTCHKFEPWHRQLHAYNFCLRDYGARHQFMGGWVGGLWALWSRLAGSGSGGGAACTLPPAASTSPWIRPVLFVAAEHC